VNSRRVGPIASVALITAAALVGVVVLAIQAAGSAPKVAKAAPAASQQTLPSAQPSDNQPQTPAPDPNALPASSGSGKRIVYSVAQAKIWLVDGQGAVQRVNQVVPGTQTPTAGSYKVTGWTQASLGGDRVSVQYVVLWGPGSPSKYGFDAVAGVSGLPPKPSRPTGAVRMSQDDALAVWTFATGQRGLPVVVVQ
jgi:hypothetical protein